MECPACKKPISPGDLVQRIPSICRLEIGKKSGREILIPVTGEDKTDYVHFGCTFTHLDPESDSDIYELLEDRIRDEVREDEKCIARDELLNGIEPAPNCPHCMETIDVCPHCHRDIKTCPHCAQALFEDIDEYDEEEEDVNISSSFLPPAYPNPIS